MTLSSRVGEDVSLFLAHAIQLERDAARRFEDLTHAMQTAGNREVERLFRRLGELSRKHLASAMARSGFREMPVLGTGEFQWPEGLTPEAAGWQGVDDTLDVRGALEVALAGELSGFHWYAGVAKTATDPEVTRMARDFADEEQGHVSELQRWIVRQSKDEAAPPASGPSSLR